MIRSTSRLTALLAVGVLALAGCTGGGDDPSPSPTDQAASQPASDGGAGSTYPTSGSDAGGSEIEPEDCKADDSDQSVPSEAPKADAWPLANGAGVPVSDTFGPTERDGEVWSCFAHSPTGALFAAAYIRGAAGDPAVREDYLDDPVSEEGRTSAAGVDLRGYKFTSYDDSSVSVELVYETKQNGESALVAFPVTVYWEDNQWVAHRADFESAEPSSITGLTGYTQWSAAS